MIVPAPSRRDRATVPRRRLRFAGPLVIGIAAIAGVAVACSPGQATSSPAGSGSTASGSPGPRPTSWPTTTVEAAIALGAADGDFKVMANDVVGAVNSQDPAEILRVITKAIEFLTENQKNIPHLQSYEATKSVGDRLADAYATMLAGATQIRDGLTTGNADDVEAGFTLFFEGNATYVSISPELGDLADQAVFMKRQLLQ
jgi:hypothetical protein